MSTITESELADRWKVTVRTLQNWRKAGTGPAYIRLGERSIVYRLRDVEAFESDRREGAPDWRPSVKRAAAAFDLMSQKARTAQSRQVLLEMRDELRALLERGTK